jgi:DNA-binding CsgD family transcriptional regulator
MSNNAVEEDLQGLIALLANVAGMTATLPARREALLQGLADLIGAQCWFWLIGAGVEPDRDPAAVTFQTGGWKSEQFSLVMGAMHSPAGMLVHRFFRRRFQQHATCIRADLADTRQWHDSDFYRNYLQLAGLDDILISAFPLPQNLVSGAAFFRSPAAGPFAHRHRAMVHRIMAQALWIHSGPASPAVVDAAPVLSRRCREVLVHLLNGDSRKQIARKLHRSENTIADNIKTIHRQFGVSSRGELMAKFLSGTLLETLGDPTATETASAESPR